MKKQTLLLLLLVTGSFTGGYAQVKVGDNPTSINANSLLELESGSKGLLLPRMALSAVNSASPMSAFVAGMAVYNTATAGVGTNAVTPGYYFSDGSRWVRLADASQADLTKDAWVDDNTTGTIKLGTQSDGSTARTAGTEFVVRDNGNVGIGTASPIATLHVKNGDFRLENEGNWNAYKGVTYSNTHYPQLFLFKARGTKASPSYPQATNTMGVFRVVNAIDSAGGAGFRITAAETQTASAHGSSLTVFTTANGQSANEDRFIVDHNGNVGIGIGTSAPNSRLHVSTDAAATTYLPIGEFYAPNNTTSGNNSMLRFGVSNTTRNSGEMRFHYVGSGSTSNSIDFSFNGVTAPPMSILASGNVGIGATDPSATLEINGNMEIGTVSNVANDTQFKPLLWNPTTKRVETANDNTNIRKVVTSVASGGTASVYTVTASGVSAYDIKVSVENACVVGAYNKFVLQGSNVRWSLNFVGGVSSNGASSATNTDFHTVAVTNPVSGCADGGSTSAFNYTLAVNATTGEISITNNGNITRNYSIIIEKAFD